MLLENSFCLCKIIYVGNSLSYDVCRHLNNFASRSSRPRVPVCFSCNRALYTSYIAIGGIVKVEFDIFDSQKRFKKVKSFSFD